jgi:microcystin-dependent protein
MTAVPQPGFSIIQLRRATASDWNTNNPILRKGEMGYDITNKQIKIGDGLTAWNDLYYSTIPNVNIASPQNNQALIYNTGKWVNSLVSSLANNTVTNLSIADNAVTSTKISDNAIVDTKINSAAYSVLNPTGGLMAFAGSTAPNGWLVCDGTAISRSTYSALYTVIGTTYGIGDGTTTFNLPDLRGRVPVGKNSGSFGTLGSTGGAETHRHNFKFSLIDYSYAVTGPNGAMGTAVGQAGAYKYSTGAYQGGTSAGTISTTINSNIFSGTAQTGVTTNKYESQGDTDTGSSLPPYQVINYIIKT